MSIRNAGPAPARLKLYYRAIKINALPVSDAAIGNTKVTRNTTILSLAL